MADRHSIAGPASSSTTRPRSRPEIRSRSAAASRPSRCCGRSTARCFARAGSRCFCHRSAKHRPTFSISRPTSSWPISHRSNGGCARRHTVSIDVHASTNTRALSAVDPSRQSVWTRARTELRQTAFARAARGERRWSSTIFPTPAHAQDADMATDEFAAFLEAACMLDRPDPIAAWRELSARQARMIGWLQERK